jgi:hypothetical protein
MRSHLRTLPAAAMVAVALSVPTLAAAQDGPPPPPPQMTPPEVPSGPATPTPKGCVVPSLRGLVLARARASLERAGCRLGAVTVARGGDRRRGIVVGQAYAPSSILEPSARVDVKVGTRRA